MRIAVFVKQIPKADTVQMDPTTGNLRREGVESTVNPMDLNAIEAALHLKEQRGATVIAVSMGPGQASAALRVALAMGCDESVLLCDRAFAGADTLATGYTLAKAAEKLGDLDMLIFGRAASDAETAQTGPAVAALLGLPQATYVTALESDGEYAYCRRTLGQRVEQVKLKLPAAIMVCAEINTPRYPTIRGIMGVKAKRQRVWTCADMACDPGRVGTNGSPSVNKRLLQPESKKTETRFLSQDTDEAAVQFVDMLEAEHLI